jgi:YidC/Oxa1 family membrane protein insertase
MVLRKGALDHYDTIFCVGRFQFDEIRESEKLYQLKEKNLIECGYGILENMYDLYERGEKREKSKIKILIAPSWQEDNILDSCIDNVLSNLLGHGYEIVVRPHPEYVKRHSAKMDAIVKQYKNYPADDLSFELDFSKSNSIFDSDIVITDWSGTAYEFSFVTKKPSAFINTPPKINNLEYNRISVKPLEILLRDKVGIQIDIKDLSGLNDRIVQLLGDSEKHKYQIDELLHQYISNFGQSGEIGARYIINRLK